ncbi:MAG: xanthine dehydrogenase family protein subunit M [Candidatus Rokubacteria bacterium]|nr:xanthine dehydrogenase family protein subunit M [Candidatus Rokubacteria bacterium]
MRLPPFELVEPESLAEACRLLGGGDAESRLLAGGTALVPMLRLGLVRPERLVSLARVPGLDGLRLEADAVRIGAMSAIAGLHRSATLRGGWPLLAEACGRVASPAIRSTATLGGNLAYAEAASDVTPALLCLEAQVSVAGESGERQVPIGEFFRGFYETALEPGEVVTGVRLPRLIEGARTGYVKFCPRSAEDKPLIGVAAVLVLDGAGRVATDVRIGLGGAAPTPLRARRAEAALRGEPLGDPAIRAAADAAAGEAEPLSDVMGSAEYRRDMIRVWVRRLLTGLRDGRAAHASG